MYIVCVRSHFRSSFASCSELCVQNSCVQPAAMADPPSMIRIGKEKYMTYKCGRGSDWAGWGEVLWLMKGENNNWYAFDAPETPVPTDVNHDKVIFETADANAHIAGQHTWIMKKSQGERPGMIETFLISID